MAELRQARRGQAALFANALPALFHDLKLDEQQTGRHFITYPARRVDSVNEVPIKAVQLACQETS